MDDTFHLAAQFGVVQGAAIAEILRRYEQAAFDAEWDELRSRVGDDACTSMLERTNSQRRADALHAIFQAAASPPMGAHAPEPVVNIIAHQQTFQTHWRAATTGGLLPHQPTPAISAAVAKPSTGLSSIQPT